jgi:nucleotide-binding universal stress UspA family protein
MKGFKNILVYMDRDPEGLDDPVIRRAIDLATGNNGTLTFMDVVPTPNNLIQEYKVFFSAAELTRMMVKRRKTQLAKITETVNNLGIKAKTLVVAGHNYLEIIRQVINNSQDLVMKLSPAKGDGFTSVDLHLMRKCPCPLWIIKSGPKSQHKHILATLDLAQEEQQQGALMNRLIMDLATSLAILEQAKLEVLCCWSLYGEESIRDNVFLNISDEELEELIRSEELVNRSHLDDLCASYTQLEYKKHLVKGDPKECIPAFVSSNNIDTVVMGTVGRTGIPGLLMGNTAETVLQAIDSSVITVKPNDFQTPIK